MCYNIVTQFIAFLRFRCQIVIFLAILQSLTTKTAKNLKLCYYIVLYRAPRARDIRKLSQLNAFCLIDHFVETELFQPIL